MATWPPGLPQRLRIPFAFAPLDNRISNELDEGPNQRRPRDLTRPWVHSGTVLVTDAQFLTLEDFYDNTLAQGAGRFDFPHPYTQTLEIAEFVDPPSLQGISGSLSVVSLSLLLRLNDN